MLLQRRRVLSALAPRLISTGLAVASVAAMFLVAGVASASAAPGSACPSTNTSSGAPTTSPTNPFGSNVTIFNSSESLSTINAALNAPSSAPREFFFLPGTYGSALATTATATVSNTIQASVDRNAIVAGLGSSPATL